MFYFVFCIIILLSMFGLSSACYDVVLFVILLRCFICMRAIQIGKTNLINRYQIIVVSMLKNWNCKYFSHYFMKFLGFMTIYYTINPVVSSYMVFSHLYLGSIDLLLV